MGPKGSGLGQIEYIVVGGISGFGNLLRNDLFFANHVGGR